MTPPGSPLADLTGAELFAFETDASAHGTPDEVSAARAELVRRVGQLTPPSTAPSAN